VPAIRSIVTYYAVANLLFVAALVLHARS
jgi:hypothetical protein